MIMPISCRFAIVTSAVGPCPFSVFTAPSRSSTIQFRFAPVSLIVLQLHQACTHPFIPTLLATCSHVLLKGNPSTSTLPLNKLHQPPHAPRRICLQPVCARPANPHPAKRAPPPVLRIHRPADHARHRRMSVRRLLHVGMVLVAHEVDSCQGWGRDIEGVVWDLAWGRNDDQGWCGHWSWCSK